MNCLRLLCPDGRWPADLQLWQLSLDGEGTGSLCLSADEQARASRYRRPAERQRFSQTRSALRQLLGQQLALDPASLQFDYSARGQPQLRGHAIHFNVSHADHAALIALSPQRLLGVDIEPLDAAADWPVLATLACGAGEQRRLTGSADFLQCWTGKEALLKSCGLGIADGLQRLDLSGLLGQRSGQLHLPDGQQRQLCWLDDMADHLSCMAWSINRHS